MITHDFTEFTVGAMPKLQRLALALCAGDAHEANDLVQASLERLLVAWHKQRLDDPLAYARKVLVHELATSRRGLRWKREHLTGQAPESALPAEDIASQISDRVTLHQALAGLPTRQRHTVVLRYLEDLSVEEVSALLRCTPGTVKRASHDGLHSLRARLTVNTESTTAGDSNDHRQART